MKGLKILLIFLLVIGISFGMNQTSSAKMKSFGRRMYVPPEEITWPRPADLVKPRVYSHYKDSAGRYCVESRLVVAHNQDGSDVFSTKGPFNIKRYNRVPVGSESTGYVYDENSLVHIDHYDQTSGKISRKDINFNKGKVTESEIYKDNTGRATDDIMRREFYKWDRPSGVGPYRTDTYAYTDQNNLESITMKFDTTQFANIDKITYFYTEKDGVPVSKIGNTKQRDEYARGFSKEAGYEPIVRDSYTTNGERKERIVRIAITVGNTTSLKIKQFVKYDPQS